MGGFDPKKYLQSKGFNPKAYLQDKGVAADATAQPNVTPTQETPYATQMLENFPSSLGNLAEGMAQPFLHPLQTAEGIGRLLWAGLKVGPGGMGGSIEDKQTLAPMAKDLIDRYGSFEALANTVKTDPAGFLADLSTFLEGGGAVLKGFKEGGAIAKVGEGLKTTAAVTDPVAVYGNTVRKTVTAGGRAERQYTKALKPPTNLPLSETKRLVKTGIEERIVPGSAKGFEKLMDSIDELNTKVTSAIDASTKSGQTINSFEIIDKLDELKKYYESDPHRTKIWKKIDDLSEEFLADHGQTLTVAEAQKLKQRTMRTVREVYSPTTGERIPTVAKKWREAFAGSLREKIAELVPEVADLNKRESDLLNLKKYIESAVSKREQHTLGSFSPLIVASGGAGTGSLLVLAKEIISSPGFRARLAFVLDHAKKRGLQTSKVLKPAAIIERSKEDQ